jgi:hypothetical protein
MAIQSSFHSAAVAAEQKKDKGQETSGKGEGSLQGRSFFIE